MSRYELAIVGVCSAGVFLLSGCLAKAVRLQAINENHILPAELMAFAFEHQPTSWSAVQINPILANDSQEQRIPFSHFSFQSLENLGWETSQQGRQRVEFGKSTGAGLCIATAFEQSVLDSLLRQASASEVADFYRERERQGMVQMGVNRGLYELEDVVMGEEDINDKHFFTMKYKTIIDSAVMNNSLYLFFPRTENNDFFFGAVYSEGPVRRDAYESTCQADFLELLSSVESVTPPTPKTVL